MLRSFAFGLATACFCFFCFPPTLFASISSDGSFSYSFPIEVPAGVRGIQPSLSLSLNSEMGNGSCGIGCQLAGLAAIGRTEQDKGIHFGNADSYTGPNGLLVDISGNRSVFYNKFQNWSKFVPLGACGMVGEPCSWTETVADGSKNFYGNTADSRIEALDRNGAVRVWALHRNEDLFGNGYNVTYLEDGSGAYYPQKISYGNHLIEFTWIDRLDSVAEYHGGGKVSQTKLLSKISGANV